MKIRIPALCLVAAAGLAASAARANDDESVTATARLSAPGQPGTFILDIPWAEIRIDGVDGDTVTVESTLAQKDAKPTRPGGLRRLDDEVSFELTEKNNVVSLRLAGDNRWAGHDAEFRITVPRALALQIKTEMGGDLVVRDVHGDVEVNNMNGQVRLEGLVGSAVISTMNGEVCAVYAKAPVKPISITSMNGEIDLRVPADTKANVRMNTHNGSILTDFDETVLKTKSEGARGYSYSYGRSDAARTAAEAARAAIQISREIAHEVRSEIERASREDADAPEAVGTPEPGTPSAPRAPKAPRAPRPPVPPVTGGKVVSGTLNGGGIDIKMSTMNGEITLRQTKESGD